MDGAGDELAAAVPDRLASVVEPEGTAPEPMQLRGQRLFGGDRVAHASPLHRRPPCRDFGPLLRLSTSLFLASP